MPELLPISSIELRIPHAQVAASGSVVAVRLDSGKTLPAHQLELMRALDGYTKVADATIANLEVGGQRTTWRMGHDGWFGLFIKNDRIQAPKTSKVVSSPEVRLPVSRKKDDRAESLLTMAQSVDRWLKEGHTAFVLSTIQTQNQAKLDFKLTAL